MINKERQLHLQRCETCANVNCKYNPDVVGYTINYYTDNVWEITKEIGCASYICINFIERVGRIDE